jgi:hypothetical protein
MKLAYEALKKEVNRKCKMSALEQNSFGERCYPLIETLYNAAKNELSQCERLQLESKVKGKAYFAYQHLKTRSRPINLDLFETGNEMAIGNFLKILEGKRHELTSDQITRSVYIVAMTCCAGKDVSSRGDQKTPGTIFEWLCAAIMKACLNVNPVRALQVLNLDLKGDLPTDFVYDLGPEKPKFHLPVKTSTRERIIQVWAHQRVLDGVYGVGRFLAMPIILTETKLDSKKLEVVEICLPWQWRLYQMHIAVIWNVCYLDAPTSYLELDTKFPRIGVSTIGDALVKDGRLDELLRSHSLIA